MHQAEALRIISKKTGVTELLSLGVRSDIIAIKPLNPKELIILTSGDGFFVYNPLTGEKKHYETGSNPVMPSDRMISAYLDRYGEVWLETSADGVLHFDPLNGTMKHFRMKVDPTNPFVLLPSFAIFEDINDNLWVYPRGGGFALYNRAEQRLEYFFNEPGSADRRFPNLIHSAIGRSPGQSLDVHHPAGYRKGFLFPQPVQCAEPQAGSFNTFGK